MYEDNEGLVRCKGRLSETTDISEEAAHPLYLSRKSLLVNLIIMDIHLKRRHCGSNTLISEFRQEFWSPQLGRSVRQALYHDPRTRCTECCKFVALPAAEPAEPNLPIERIEFNPPFTHVGIDFFGPMKVRINNEVEKAYGIIFSCLTSRAIHLESSSDATTERFLMAFRRFVARRGAPKTIISDNAKQFLLADKVLYEQFREIILDERTQNYSTMQGVTWRFITERAPWRGATYERLIGLVKACLKRTIGRRLLSIEELTTMLVEVEQVVNLRPLARAAEDQVEPIILPIDLLRPLSRDINFLAGDEDEDDPEYRPKGETNLRILTRINLRTAARLQYFWKMFLEQYLLDLRERWQNKAGKGPKLREGQIVIIHNEELPRNLWKLGRVQKLSARTAEVKMVPG